MAVLDALIAEHLLVRSQGTPGGYSFQHQQFQEWYASFAVENAMRNMAAGDATAAEQLAIAFLDVRPWEESILFACERMAPGSDADVDAVAKTIIRCLSIDPMLAAEIIFRAPAAWGRVEHEVTGFLRRWHQPGKVDRAIGFIVNSGRPDFAELLWPLLADSEHRRHLDVLRSGRRFPPSLLPHIETRLATLEESTRAEILGEMVDHGGMEGALTATSLAQSDPSVHVKKEVVESLYWRGADQQAARVLQDAPPELWQELASGHPFTGIHNTAVATRMAVERRSAFERMQNPGHRLHYVLNGGVDGIETEQEVFRLLADPALEVRASAADHALHQAYVRFPLVVASALVRRIEHGLEIPFRAHLLVQEQHIVTDEEPIPGMVNDAALDEKIRTNAASIAGPVSIGRLIDAQLELDTRAASHPAARRPLAELTGERFSPSTTSYCSSIHCADNSLISAFAQDKLPAVEPCLVSINQWKAGHQRNEIYSASSLLHHADFQHHPFPHHRPYGCSLKPRIERAFFIHLDRQIRNDQSSPTVAACCFEVTEQVFAPQEYANRHFLGSSNQELPIVLCQREQ